MDNQVFGGIAPFSFSNHNNTLFLIYPYGEVYDLKAIGIEMLGQAVRIRHAFYTLNREVIKESANTRLPEHLQLE